MSPYTTCLFCGSPRPGKRQGLSLPCPQPDCRRTYQEAADDAMAVRCLQLMGDRYAVTLAVAELIAGSGYRFDSSWRHADTGLKAEVYARCCTFAANEIADHPERAEFWREYLQPESLVTR